MSKEEIKSILIDLICDYDPKRWSNEDVYCKYADLLYDKIENSNAELKEKYLNISHIDLIRKIADLEAKLAESKESCILLESLRKSEAEKKDIAVKRVTELKQQLAEKDKELHYKTAECEKWKADYENCSELEKMMTKERQYCLDNWRASWQDKISFCIEKLVDIQKHISDNPVGAEQECFGREINEFIDNQIEELKKEMK